MKLNCSAKMVKYLMIIFNLLFVITGIILLAIGVSVKTVYREYQTFLDDQYFSLPNMLIATGSIIFIISFCGCCGALKESWLLTGIFATLLIVIFIFELSIGIAGYVLRNRTYDFLHEELLKNQQLYKDSEKLVMKMWDLVQSDFECCGVDNYTDWRNVFNNDSLPISCCPREYGAVGVFYCNAVVINSSRVVRQAPAIDENATTPSGAAPVPAGPPVLTETTSTVAPIESSSIATTTLEPTTSLPYNIGCAVKFSSFIQSHAGDLAGAGIALAVIQVLGIGFAFYLTNQLKHGYYST